MICHRRHGSSSSCGVWRWAAYVSIGLATERAGYEGEGRRQQLGHGVIFRREGWVPQLLQLDTMFPVLDVLLPYLLGKLDGVLHG